MRTVIQEIDGIPQQTVLCDFRYEIEFRDFSHDPEPDAAVRAWMKGRCQVVFDLAKGLFDCALVKLSDRRFVWFLNLHHIIGDGRSIELIYHHAAQFYERSQAGYLERKAELPTFRQYVDYEREYRSSDRRREAERYWKTKFAAPAETLRFYGKKTLKTTTRIEKISCELGSQRTRKLKQLASSPNIAVKTENASLFNVFATILSTYLYRITGCREPSIGTTFHNRRSKTFRGTIGLLMEVLPLRVAIEEDETFASLTLKIASEAYNAFRNSDSMGNSPGKRMYDVLFLRER